MDHSWTAKIIVIILLFTAGCSDSLPDSTVQKTGSMVPAGLPRETVAVPEQSSDMALQPEDLPSDYILQDRTVMALPEVSQLARELGWRQGYYVSFYRKNINTNDITRIRQTISIFSSDSIDGIFLLEKEDLKNQQLSPGSRYEIPFPAVGKRSIAFRDTNPVDPERPVTYTVVFIKGDVFEKITMSGTNTDYETLKRLVLRAEARIR